jgi:hypothetical protein
LIDNPGAPLGIALLEWGAYEIVGDAETGYLVEFDPPLAPGVDEVQLGTLTVISYDESWPLENHVMHISDPGVWDIYGQRAYTSRGYLTFNPDTWTSCLLDGDYATADTHAGNIWPPQGAEVVDLLNLDFTVNSWFCMPGSSAFFTGEILVDGLVAHTFSGEGDMGFSLPVDASGYVSGCDLQVDILLHGSREGHAEIHYEVGEATNSESTSFSVVKACY